MNQARLNAFKVIVGSPVDVELNIFAARVREFADKFGLDIDSSKEDGMPESYEIAPTICGQWPDEIGPISSVLERAGVWEQRSAVCKMGIAEIMLAFNVFLRTNERVFKAMRED